MLIGLSTCSVYDTSLLGLTRGGGGDAASDTGGARTESGGSSASGKANAGSVANAGREAGSGGAGAGGAQEVGGTANGGSPNDSGGTLGGGAETGGGMVGGANASGGGSVGSGANAGGGGSVSGATNGGATPGGTSGGGSGADAGNCSVVDCCPTDPAKTAPGECGCGTPDQDTTNSAGCVGLKNALAHRYSFSGSGVLAADSAGGAGGLVVNAQLSGAGTLTLAGAASDQFVELPNRIISSLGNASFELWLTWNGGGAGQRLFEFGSAEGGEDVQDGGATYLFLNAGTASESIRAAFSTGGVQEETVLQGTTTIGQGARTHVVLVVDDSRDLMSLYVGRALKGSIAFGGNLSSLDDINNWLGRSQNGAPSLSATLDEFRIFRVALSANQIALSDVAGPTPSFLP